MKKTFRSNGKLLITGEYVVLDGAKALAVPTKFGQSLTIEESSTRSIVWKSYNELDEIWFEDVFKINNADFLRTVKKDYSVLTRLIQTLKAAQILNPEFLNSDQGYDITTQQNFNRKWGLGTSSTLINNIANWAKVDAYRLLQKTFGGSGYDIACAQNDTSITYQLISPSERLIEPVAFNPSFKGNLYFIYLNQKQDSRDGIASYKKSGKINSSAINDISMISEAIIDCKFLPEFEELIIKHESIISKLTKQETVKSRLFKDFNGTVKSLGAWGGDFVLATSEYNPTEYFSSKGFKTVIPYEDMVL